MNTEQAGYGWLDGLTTREHNVLNNFDLLDYKAARSAVLSGKFHPKIQRGLGWKNYTRIVLQLHTVEPMPLNALLR